MKLFRKIKRWFKFQLTYGKVMYTDGIASGSIRRSLRRSYINKGN